MTVSEIIDQVLSYTDNIPPTDADYANRRIRLLNYLREVLAKTWYTREWPFSRREVVATVGAGDAYAEAPDRFLKLGDYGSVYLAEQPSGEPLDNVPEYRIVASRQTGSTTDVPAIFSIFDQNPTTFLPRFQFPSNSGAYDIIVSFLLKVPLIDDGGPLNTAIDEVPEQYHQSVIVPGLQARTLQSKGDATWNSTQGFHEAALNDMKVQERRRQGTIYQLPSFFGNRRGRGA